MSKPDWPAALEAMERDTFEDRSAEAEYARQSRREAAEGVIVGVIGTALLMLVIGCAIFGARVVLGGG